MEHNPFKQRLVGGIILVSLAVIILPMIFGERGEQGIDESNIPVKPERMVKTEIIPLEIKKLPEKEDVVKRRVVEQPSKPAEAPKPEVVEQKPVTEVVVEKKVAEAPKAKPEPAPKSKPAPVVTEQDQEKSKRAVIGWVVQVGSFSNEKNALALRDKLRKQKFPAFVEELTASNGNKAYRVRVGPELDADHAQALRERLLKKAKVEGIVMHHR